MDYNTQALKAVEERNCVALIARLYGKGGELVVKLLDNFPKQTELLWIVCDQIATPLFVSKITPQGASKAVVVFQDFETEELASQLIGKKLYAQNAQMEQEEVGELDFMVGFEFEDLASGCKGRIVEVFESELNPLINVELTGRSEQVLIPLAEPLIEKMDAKRKRLTMRLVEGFFENFS